MMTTEDRVLMTCAVAIALIIAGFIVLASTVARAETIRNDRGQVVGYGDRRGAATTYRDSMGRQVGRSVKSPHGTTLYDASGRQIGTTRR